MKIELTITDLTSDEINTILRKERKFTKENIMVFNSDESAREGALLETIFESHNGLFQFLQTVKVRAI